MRIEIDRVETAFDSLSFANIGVYEKVMGHAVGEIDPAHPLNARIVNIRKAPTKAAGRVEYKVDFYLLKPADLRRGNRRLFYDVVNRGNKLALNNLNDAPRVNDPCVAADAGNGFLTRRGYSLLWSGWQGDVGEASDVLRAQLPIATERDAPLVAPNRDEFILEHTRSPVTLSLSYPANTLDQQAATLTVRQREQDSRTLLSPEHWCFKSNTKIEINRHGLNRRFVVTNLCGDGRGIYHGFYVRRGAVPEKPIGELKMACRWIGCRFIVFAPTG